MVLRFLPAPNIFSPDILIMGTRVVALQAKASAALMFWAAESSTNSLFCLRPLGEPSLIMFGSVFLPGLSLTYLIARGQILSLDSLQTSLSTLPNSSLCSCYWRSIHRHNTVVKRFSSPQSWCARPALANSEWMSWRCKECSSCWQ